MRRQITKSPYGTLILKQMIGKGSYGQIYKAYATSEQKQYAVKIISSDSDADSLKNIERQIKILMSCNHPNIVKCHGVQIIDEMVWIVMDYYQLGSLSDVMTKERRTFSEQQIHSIVKQIVSALVYLHDKKIIHRDIKAANILVSHNGQIKVADFGVSTLLNHSQGIRNTRTGSPLWMSPQLLSNSHYSFKTDIWSLGITALELAEGVPPYSHQHPYRAIFSIQAHPPQSLTQPHKWSSHFNNFISKCLTLDQNKRPSAKQLQNHPFLSIQDLEFKKISIEPYPKYSSFKDHQTKSYGISQNFGTMIMHSQCDDSIWQKKKPQLKLNLNTENKQNESWGTFKMNTNQNESMEPKLLAQITNILSQKTNLQNRNKKQCQLIKPSIECLYAQMQEQIGKIRKKYLQKIRQLQNAQLLTFEQQLKKTKERGLKMSSLHSIQQ